MKRYEAYERGTGLSNAIRELDERKIDRVTNDMIHDMKEERNQEKKEFMYDKEGEKLDSAIKKAKTKRQRTDDTEKANKLTNIINVLRGTKSIMKDYTLSKGRGNSKKINM